MSRGINNMTERMMALKAMEKYCFSDGETIFALMSVSHSSKTSAEYILQAASLCDLKFDMGDMAAAFVLANRNGIGDCFMVDPNVECGISHVITSNDGLVHVTRFEHRTAVFSGGMREFLEYGRKQENVCHAASTK